MWDTYQSLLVDWAADYDITLPTVPDYVEQAYHMYYILLPSLEVRTKVIKHLRDLGIWAVFHYQPLNLSGMGHDYAGYEGASVR